MSENTNLERRCRNSSMLNQRNPKIEPKR